MGLRSQKRLAAFELIHHSLWAKVLKVNKVDNPQNSQLCPYGMDV